MGNTIRWVLSLGCPYRLKDMQLDSIQLRVLGSLIEKEITTPENYPLSLNALVNACNQRSSRDPVLELDEEQVRQALHGLEEMALATPVRDARVPKYEHRARTVLTLRRDETAILCLLMLRGPQTPGELRSRADRLFAFEDLAAVQSTLERLAARPAVQPDQPGTAEATGPLTAILPRQPGSREARYIHLLGCPPDASLTHPSAAADRVETGNITSSNVSQRLAQLESEVVALSTAIQSLQARLDRLEQGI